MSSVFAGTKNMFDFSQTKLIVKEKDINLSVTQATQESFRVFSTGVEPI